jgi:hypothetical protein
MKILSVHAGMDTGGQSARIKQAFDRHSDWSFRYATKPTGFSYINYPGDLPFRPMALRQMWSEIDVVHAHNDFRAVRMLEQEFADKPAVIHYHGTSFRGAPFPRLAEQRKRGALGIVSTLDLWLLAPEETEWLPAPYDLEWLASLR